MLCCISSCSVMHHEVHVPRMQVDIVVDETFAPAPAAYTYNQFLKEYGISPALAANVAFLNGTNASA